MNGPCYTTSLSVKICMYCRDPPPVSIITPLEPSEVARDSILEYKSLIPSF